MNDIKIDIVVPVFNEEKYLDNCITSILNFILFNNCTIVIYIVDGLSTDNTKKIALQYESKFINVKYILNPQKIQSCALNKIIEIGDGDYILRLDAHSIYPNDYLFNCYNISYQTSADNVGGIIITLPGGSNFEAKIVQAITTHKFGVGNSDFRTIEKVGNSDTVPFGFFKKSIFYKIGNFDERLTRCQDYEFNRRIIANGGKIWMNSKICAEYYNQPTLLGFYKKQLFNEAPFNPYMWYLAPYSFAFRHVITGFFTLGVILGLFLSFISNIFSIVYFLTLLFYFTLGIISSIQQSIKYKNFILIFILPFCFFLFHFLHGFGIIIGAMKLITKTAPINRINKPWENAETYYSKYEKLLILPKFIYSKFNLQ